ncbi:MAG: YceI family protein [Parvularculaceae bacterium]
MPERPRLRPAAAGFAFLAVAGAAACAQLITPDVSTEAGALRAGAYRLDPDHAVLLFKLNHLGFSTFVGRFNDIEASLDFDESDPAAARLDARVATASIDVNNPEFEETLRGPGWFDTERFPEARFVSTEIEITGENTGRVTGDFTLMGETRPVTLDVTFNGGARNLLTRRYTLGFAASGAFSRSAFGLDNFAPAVGDQVTLEIHAEFQRQ